MRDIIDRLKLLAALSDNSEDAVTAADAAAEIAVLRALVEHLEAVIVRMTASHTRN